MIRDVAIDLLNLIKKNDGLEKYDIYKNPSIDVQKIIDIISSESKCSIIDSNGNYIRFGSSIDISIIKNLIKIFLSNLGEIPPEIVSMLLTKEEILGPFLQLKFNKNFNNDEFILELQQIFPENFKNNILDNNLEFKNHFIDEIVKLYVKNRIFENDNLVNKSPIGAWISKKTTTFKNDDELQEDLIQLLSETINVDENLKENIASYLLVNIMGNKSFREELVNNTLNTTELQMLGKIYTGFNGLVENMTSEVIKMIELKEFPIDEYENIKGVFYTIIAILTTLSTSLNNKSDNEILKDIEKINLIFNYADGNFVSVDKLYRSSEIHTDKYENIMEFVNPDNIEEAMKNLCKMIRVLLENKENISMENYIKEVIRIHYRFLRIHPFEKANGRTARALVNMLLQERNLIGVFRKEKRKEYINSIKEANKIIKDNEMEYVIYLVNNPMECMKLENEFLEKELPFLLVKY